MPLLFGLHDLYPWARWTAEEVSGSEMLTLKAQYLNEPAFTVRAAGYFAVSFMVPRSRL